MNSSKLTQTERTGWGEGGSFFNFMYHVLNDWKCEDSNDATFGGGGGGDLFLILCIMY